MKHFKPSKFFYENELKNELLYASTAVSGSQDS